MLPDEIRAAIGEWLASGEVDLFIGWEPGTLALTATPAFVQRAEDVDRLIWDATCEHNLTRFVRPYRDKTVGIMVKGCDARALVGLMQEGQLVRERLRIVGIGCDGVIDPRRVCERLGVESAEELDDARLDGNEIVCGRVRIPIAEVLFAGCETCQQRDPQVYDLRMGPEHDDAPLEDRYAHVRAMEALSEDERWERFTSEISRCNLCYACRNACPFCYCNVCFAEQTNPQWLTPTAHDPDVAFFQIIRTFHLAGRCVACGACTRACPQGVDLRLMLDKLCADVADLYGYVAGEDAEAKPPLTTYRQDDYNDFVL